ncbi:hypothetical protein ACFOYU_24490 [Microvirga sp. GCM10011540]|uniref:hypothetical protein n=1 Tax=Microvirga sp. GCM10011540 TaxID=3317338 RepID=UPI0036223975
MKVGDHRGGFGNARIIRRLDCDRMGGGSPADVGEVDLDLEVLVEGAGCMTIGQGPDDLFHLRARGGEVDVDLDRTRRRIVEGADGSPCDGDVAVSIQGDPVHLGDPKDVVPARPGRDVDLDLSNAAVAIDRVVVGDYRVGARVEKEGIASGAVNPVATEIRHDGSPMGRRRLSRCVLDRLDALPVQSQPLDFGEGAGGQDQLVALGMMAMNLQGQLEAADHDHGLVSLEADMLDVRDRSVTQIDRRAADGEAVVIGLCNAPAVYSSNITQLLSGKGYGVHGVRTRDRLDSTQRDLLQVGNAAVVEAQGVVACSAGDLVACRKVETPCHENIVGAGAGEVIRSHRQDMSIGWTDDDVDPCCGRFFIIGIELDRSVLSRDRIRVGGRARVGERPNEPLYEFGRCCCGELNLEIRIVACDRRERSDQDVVRRVVVARMIDQNLTLIGDGDAVPLGNTKLVGSIAVPKRDVQESQVPAWNGYGRVRFLVQENRFVRRCFDYLKVEILNDRRCFRERLHIEPGLRRSEKDGIGRMVGHDLSPRCCGATFPPGSSAAGVQDNYL